MGIQKLFMEGSAVILEQWHDLIEAMEIDVEYGERGYWLQDKLRWGEWRAGGLHGKVCEQ